MMKLLIVLSVVAYASATPLIGGKRCTWGPSYWCSDISKAKECGALNHCISTVWSQHEKTKDGDSPVCEFCQGVVTEIRKLLLRNETESQIRDYVKKACSLIPETFMQDECNNVADHYLDELIQMIDSQLDPVAICEAIKLCNSTFVDKIHHPAIPKLKIPVNDNTTCNECKSYISDLQKMVTDNSTVQEVENYIEQNVCAQLGGLEDECKQLVEEYAPELFEMIASKLDPEAVCKAMGFCSGDRRILISMRLMKTKFYKEMEKLPGRSLKDGEVCTVCQEVLAMLKIVETQNITQQEIEQFLEDNLCSKLGPLADMCKEAVSNYAPEIFELLANELDPETVCKAIGFCSEFKNTVKAFNIRPATVKLTHKYPVHAKASVQCILCEFVLKELDGIIAKNATTQEIEAALEKVCSLLPNSTQKDCVDFVKQYAPAIVELLVNELSPQMVCTALGLCSSSQSAIVAVKLNEATCDTCKLIVNYVDSLLGDNATIKEITQVVEKVCNFLGDSLKQECQSFVETYGPALIDTFKNMGPAKTCAALGLCNSTVAVKKEGWVKISSNQHSSNLVNDIECTMGPTYWCASMENAKKCSMAKYCEDNVWKH